MKRPIIKAKSAKSTGLRWCETIAEFSFPNGKGGLLSLRMTPEGKCIVEFYRCDEGIEGLPDEAIARHARTTFLNTIELAASDPFYKNLSECYPYVFGALSYHAGVTQDEIQAVFDNARRPK